MELAFESKDLRTICESEAYAERELGLDVAQAIKRRLADLRAATVIYDLLAGRPRISNTGNQELLVDLCDGYGIILAANHRDNPVTETGNVDWSRINRLKVLRIERYDD